MQTIAIPTYLSHLPIYQGWPVPFTQAWFDGKPDFRTVDPQKTVRCVTEKLCAICGRRLGDKSYFIGGPLSKANRVFTDPPMHKRCAEFAEQASRESKHGEDSGDGFNAAANTNVYFNRLD